MDEEDLPPSEPPELEVEDTPNPVVAELLGPAGETLSVCYERPVIVLGYSAQPKAAVRIVRVQEP